MKALVLCFLLFNLSLFPMRNNPLIEVESTLGEQSTLEVQSPQEMQKRIELLRKKAQGFLVLRASKQVEPLYEEFYFEEIPSEAIPLEETPPEENGGEISINKDYLNTLKTLGYYKNETEDEEVNNRNALLRFQSQHNLVVDGIFGEKSKEALNKRLHDEDFKYTDIIDQPATKEKWIVVNKTNRIITLYKGDKVIKKYPIAQGKTSTLTPEGKFTIVSKAINPAWGGAGIAKPVAGGSPKNPLGYRWLGISQGGGSRYGIHGNNSPLSIGTNASMGCVRMINSDVEELYDLIPLKTIVWIGTDAQIQEWGINQISYIETNIMK